MGRFLSSGFFANKPGPLAGAGLAAMEQDRIAKLELPGALPPENLSILDGSISPTRAAVIVDTEGGAPADDLTAISTTLSDGTTLHEGMELAIRAKDASRVITVKNSAAVNGILTADGKNVVLGTGWWLVLYLESGSWRQKSVTAPVNIATNNALGLVKIGNNINVANDGTISVANASTSAKGVVQINNTVTSTSTTQAATANAVKTAYDKAGTKTDPADVPVYAAPDYSRFVTISLDANNIATMPDNGFLSVRTIFNNENGYCIIYRTEIGDNNFLWAVGGGYLHHAGTIPVSKGMKIKRNSNYISAFAAIFYYAKGVIQE